ncbi:hypothetical protein LINPERHAP1_LOCUS36637 [Linum perenne]
MREKRGERGFGILGGVGVAERHSGKSLMALPLPEDRVLCTLRIRGFELRLLSSDRFADAPFRISVSGARAEHFVFADKSLLQWLASSLQEAMNLGWKLPRNCVKQSGSRALSLGYFTSKETSFLRLMEHCREGKRFYIAIPMDNMQFGWSYCLKTIQSLLSELEDSAVQINRPASFVAAVLGPKLQTSTDSKKEDSFQIVVEEEAVKDRIKRLTGWLVVSFRRGLRDPLNLNMFKGWLACWWNFKNGKEIIALGMTRGLLNAASQKKFNEFSQRKPRGNSKEWRWWLTNGVSLQDAQTLCSGMGSNGSKFLAY